MLQNSSSLNIKSGLSLYLKLSSCIYKGMFTGQVSEKNTAAFLKFSTSDPNTSLQYSPIISKLYAVE